MKKYLNTTKSLWLDGEIIGSYSTPIGIIKDYEILYTDRKYSVTTSKHKGIARNYVGLPARTIPHDEFMTELNNNNRMF